MDCLFGRGKASPLKRSYSFLLVCRARPNRSGLGGAAFVQATVRCLARYAYFKVWISIAPFMSQAGRNQDALSVAEQLESVFERFIAMNQSVGNLRSPIVAVPVWDHVSSIRVFFGAVTDHLPLSRACCHSNIFRVPRYFAMNFNTSSTFLLGSIDGVLCTQVKQIALRRHCFDTRGSRRLSSQWRAIFHLSNTTSMILLKQGRSFSPFSLQHLQSCIAGSSSAPRPGTSFRLSSEAYVRNLIKSPNSRPVADIQSSRGNRIRRSNRLSRSNTGLDIGSIYHTEHLHPCRTSDVRRQHIHDLGPYNLGHRWRVAFNHTCQMADQDLCWLRHPVFPHAILRRRTHGHRWQPRPWTKGHTRRSVRSTDCFWILRCRRSSLSCAHEEGSDQSSGHWWIALGKASLHALCCESAHPHSVNLPCCRVSPRLGWIHPEARGISFHIRRSSDAVRHVDLQLDPSQRDQGLPSGWTNGKRLETGAIDQCLSDSVATYRVEN